MSNFKDFDEYISSLKAESERGAVPNNEVPLEKFINVARNILKKLEDLRPVPSMIVPPSVRLVVRFTQGAV